MNNIDVTVEKKFKLTLREEDIIELLKEKYKSLLGLSKGFIQDSDARIKLPCDYGEGEVLRIDDTQGLDVSITVQVDVE